MAYPQHYYPGKIEGVWGAVGAFPITLAETTVSVGVVALLGLLFVLGLKYLELLPTVESGGASAAGEGDEEITASEASAPEVEG